MNKFFFLPIVIALMVPNFAAAAPSTCTVQTLRETVMQKKSQRQSLTQLQNKTWWKKCPSDVRKVVYAEFFSPQSSSQSSVKKIMKASSLPILRKAPELEGLGKWFNSVPLTLASLKGKVVFVDFWTYSCINCIHTLPAVQGYAKKYANKPFVVIGVHSPEFAFEKSEKNLAEAIKKHSLTYPIVQDNDFQTWSVFENRYWPAAYIIDAKGNLRYTHFGEGAYEEMDTVIQDLLDEIGA